MGLTSRMRSWFDNQTATEKIAITLLGLSFPVQDTVGSIIQFTGMVLLTAFAIYEKHRHEQKKSQFT